MKRFLPVLAAFVSFNALSADHNISVCSVQVQTNNIAFIQPCGNWSSKNNCQWNGWISWSLEQEGGKLMYEKALEAYSYGVNSPRVIVRTEGGSCLSGHDKISMIRITRKH
ncbi:hypothetical protein [Pseudoalteromonas luteoviolacea]|uniref:Uncharacterized protein n=1 Tax=Pseudoalteromonas luteoviolacea S4054 TaxID=1129367 RepID=A0A0F6A658_9GAMM|nr:hypothetical protein [Pseudoalteromonas luteoviolacea]AOT08142.1 hypothetical protein S4054249_09925 [Pseudoalteromonas luteoviolacea]AOT13059.1 hypothetical protein S40542_09925 [Pseudoalteromonas luteoviolacea]AOT17971.1 hypothetical protein S4054_09920 [Pseudoalteromonas luteoviolacea]KKE81660.1 hypothetical protein N479_21805 [Pseudoalteromonas luteoviolacea S4054]KZN69493.1 hypothetical protein N481_22135 [Pseudoalteromonas luteoviolacea S4047-1]